MSIDELLKIIQKTNPTMTKELLIYELSQKHGEYTERTDIDSVRASESLINTIFQKVQTSELLKLTTSTKQGRTNTQLFASLETTLKNVKRNYTDSFPMGFLKIPELGKL